MRELWSRIRSWLGGREQIDKDLREEMDAHLAFEISERIDSGRDPATAREEALREFGNRTLIREKVGETWTFPGLDNLLQDVRYGTRLLLKSPVFTAVATISLALGIGANTAIFSVVDALVLRPLDVKNPERLVMIWPRDGSPVRPSFAFYHPMFLKFRERNSVFEDVAASFLIDRSNIIVETATPQDSSDGPNTGSLRVALVSGNYFSTLGVNPIRGRAFTADDDRVEGAQAGDCYSGVAFGCAADQCRTARAHIA
jgi:hypothetical protein